MPTTFNNDGKPTYMYDSVGDVWYAVGAKIDTASGYEWAGAQTFLNTVTTDATVVFRDGFNNFLNPAARDATLTSPVQGTIVFVRQDAGGATINQIQYYTGSAWSALEADITAVNAGTGLSGGGTSGSVTLSVDTAVVATTSNTLTMTNKTLTSPVISTISNTGTLTLPTSTDTLVGRATTDTLTNKTLTSAAFNTGTVSNSILVGPEERWNVVASAATGTINIDVLTSGVWYYTSDATANHTLNFRGSSSTSMNTLLTTGDAITVLWMNTNGSTAYYPNVYQVDGTTSGVTVEWSGGTAPTSGNASGIDIYSFTILKTGDATYTVFAAGAVKYA